MELKAAGAQLLTYNTKDSLQTRFSAVSVVQMPRVKFSLEISAMRHSKHKSRNDSRSNRYADA